MVYIFPEASYFTTILREHWKDFFKTLKNSQKQNLFFMKINILKNIEFSCRTINNVDEFNGHTVLSSTSDKVKLLGRFFSSNKPPQSLDTRVVRHSY